MLHKSTIRAGNNRWIHIKFICFMSLTIICLIGSIFLAVAFGAKDIHLQTVWTAVFDYNPKLTQHQIIYELRLPRVIGAAVVGAAFAVAGAVMQGVTRNPLADAGVLGINAGAMFVVALSFAFFPHMPYSYLMVVSFIGAVLSTVLIFIIGSATAGGLTPMRLTIAGAVMAALLHSLSSGVAIYYDLSQDLAFWYAGGVAGVKWEHLKFLVPIIFITIVFATVLGRSISLISMGDDVATNLGVKTNRTRILGMITVVILAGVSVSAVGSIGFVGLVIPHIARKIVGVNYRLIIPMSALLGAMLLVLADLGARTVNPPKELAIGIMVALIGVPFFLYIARKVGREL
ncbi:ferrichrome ABC transporter permease [Bacillus thuringiensis serovar brasilensis]|uniref:FecCD family ABC transporter permease n=1 Tax=Bacillus cereus group TaxID=86661 RepID=UPI000A3D0121|nr:MULTISPECIES: iron ABC transporter permease [Bacillus cereus group]MCU5029649.1 iron ABC transporter permease [Bacillus cereus]MRA71555.1 iron chelate uptake ABC transporter family permease subunit [Bacillus thuringiensis]MRA89515.1 iron chelate uptake ABC transporter family permease subunit [Bacillus thuringiensis]MRC52161.1 iron chelate uptake ABC transporter family permease subunit [Bacillus thuringiensis]OTX27887.1 ferrichrome ABC transporter permease [Bacillus thuringiensis serovar bra